MLDDEGVGSLRVLGRDVQDEVLGVLHLEGVGHALGHAGDVAVVGQGRDAADVLGAGRTQDETPGFDDGRSFNHAHGSRPSGATAVLVHQGSGGQRGGETQTGSLVIQTPRGKFPWSGSRLLEQRDPGFCPVRVTRRP
ncbi:hypothetical protein D3C81_1637650 [compost metagenome]